MASAHVGPERLAAYLDHELSPAARDDVLAHFAECATCRREMTALRQLIQERRKRRSWSVAMPLLAVVAATIVLLVVPSARRVDNESRSSIRSGTGLTPTDQPPTISPISPADGATLEPRGAVFVWRSLGANATYRFTLQDSTGTTVWSAAAEDTSAALPDSVRLAPGEYYWSVAARLADAHSAKTGVHRFLAR
jgi:anti-sigma factor RsiW